MGRCLGYASRAMRTRRIFTPAYHPRRWGRLAAGVAAAAAAAGIAAALPGGLSGLAAAFPTWPSGTAPEALILRAAPAEVRVVDGETLRLGDRLLRLSGVAAPERGRGCRDASGAARDCGAAAAAALARLVAGREVECRVEGRDRWGRDVGPCHAGGVELGPALVAGGWAKAARGGGGGTPSALAALEESARRDGRGLWAVGAEAAGQPPRRGF